MHCSCGLEREGFLIDKAFLGGGVYSLRFETKELLPEILPGQFFMVGPHRWKSDPFLLRPFAVVDWSENDVEFLVKVVGRGSKDIVSCERGTSFRLRGPLGNGVFAATKGRSLALVAGGIGVAPLLCAWKFHSDVISSFVFGVSNRDWAGVADWASSKVSGLTVASDDGSLGCKGTAPDVLKKEGDFIDEIWACGPVSMLKAVYGAFGGKSLIMASLESRMGCGIGGCHSCAVKTQRGMLKVCHDGPVFDLSEVFLDELI